MSTFLGLGPTITGFFVGILVGFVLGAVVAAIWQGRKLDRLWKERDALVLLSNFQGAEICDLQRQNAGLARANRDHAVLS